MKRKTNLKEKPLEQKRSHGPIENDQLQAREVVEARTVTRELWQSAITDLQSVEFNDVKEALDRIAEVVVKKLDLSTEQRGEYQEILLTAMETDTGLQQALVQTLKIRTR